MSALLLSYWRNDIGRNLFKRMDHLLSKASVTRLLWVVGDSSDDTESALRLVAENEPRVRVLRADTGIVGEDIRSRRLRISATETLAYAALAEHDDVVYVIQHESDLVTEVGIADRLRSVMQSRMDITAGWPTLQLRRRKVFYDIWAYRGLDGVHFDAYAPYHRDYRAGQPFEVGSLGSVWMGARRAWENRVIREDCCVELCAQWKAEGYRLLVDPTIEVEQPTALWEVPEE